MRKGSTPAVGKESVDVLGMSTLPDMSLLTMKPRSELAGNRLAPNGTYCLNSEWTIDSLPEDCKSKIAIVRDVLKITQEARNEIFAYMEDDKAVAKTPNPSNRNTFIRRKQCTFGQAYKFGNQVSEKIDGPPEEWPFAVQAALLLGKMIASQLGYDPDAYNGVHTNLYARHDAGLAAHSDKEGTMVQGMPIISFTILGGNKPKARDFQIYDLENTKVAEIQLNDGDVIVMYGDMQQEFLHAVENVTNRPAPDPQPHKKSDFNESKRINFTVRAFRQNDEETGPKKKKKKSNPHTPPLPLPVPP